MMPLMLLLLALLTLRLRLLMLRLRMELLLVATGLLEGLGRELANKMCDSASGNLKGPANRSKKKKACVVLFATPNTQGPQCNQGARPR